MLMGLIEPTAGTARVLGQPMPRAVRAVLPHVGALIEGPALYGFLSGRDNLLRYDAADPTADPRTRRARVGATLDRVDNNRYHATSMAVPTSGGSGSGTSGKQMFP